MKSNILPRIVATFTLMCASLNSFADDNGRVLGLALGSAEVADLERAAHSAGARESSRETSAITRGPMLSYRGDFGLSGLTAATYLFWPEGVLAAAVLEIEKSRYDQITSVLKQKYTLVHETRPFVGSRSAVLRSGDTEIRVSAPHLSFSMEIVYGQVRFWTQLAEHQKVAQAKQRQQQEERL